MRRRGGALWCLGKTSYFRELVSLLIDDVAPPEKADPDRIDGGLYGTEVILPDVSLDQLASKSLLEHHESILLRSLRGIDPGPHEVVTLDTELAKLEHRPPMEEIHRPGEGFRDTASVQVIGTVVAEGN